MELLEVQNVTNEALSTAQAISDFGFMAVACGFALVLFALFSFWLRQDSQKNNNRLDDIINGVNNMMSDVRDETRKQNEILNDISEGLRPETRLRIETTAKVYFDLAIEKVCSLIKRVKDENHIVDRDATMSKIHTLVTNIHDERNAAFDNYRYQGKRLSEYSNPEWIKWVEEVMVKEVYASKANENRTKTNVKAVYERIKLDFIHRLNS